MRWEFPIPVPCMLFQVFRQALIWTISQKPLPQLCLCVVQAGFWCCWRSLMSNQRPPRDNLWCTLLQSLKILCSRTRRCKLLWLFTCDTGMYRGKKQQSFKENDFKQRWQAQTWPNRRGDRGIDWVSCRNNLTLLEHFTSNIWPGHSRGEFYFTALYLCSELCHHTFQTSTHTTTTTHTTGSVHLWALQNAFVHCIWYMGINCTWLSAGSKSQLFPCWGQQPCWTLQTWHHLNDGYNSQTLMTAFHLSHHVKCLSHYLSFRLLKSSSQQRWLNRGGL